MALNQTYTTITGRLVSEPIHKLTINDIDVTHFRVASNERRYDKQADQWVNGDQLFIDVTCWRRLAFNVKACLAKGDPVVVYGRLYTSVYEVDGKRRYEVRMEAHGVGPDLSWITTALRRRQQRTEVEGAETGSSEREVGSAAGSTSQPVNELAVNEQQLNELAANELVEPIDELARKLLDQPPEVADELDRPAEREEALMAGV
jgi:single-strand DNA-binding protein